MVNWNGNRGFAASGGPPAVGVARQITDFDAAAQTAGFCTAPAVASAYFRFLCGGGRIRVQGNRECDQGQERADKEPAMSELLEGGGRGRHGGSLRGFEKKTYGSVSSKILLPGF